MMNERTKKYMNVFVNTLCMFCSLISFLCRQSPSLTYLSLSIPAVFVLNPFPPFYSSESAKKKKQKTNQSKVTKTMEKKKKKLKR